MASQNRPGIDFELEHRLDGADMHAYSQVIGLAPQVLTAYPRSAFKSLCVLPSSSLAASSSPSAFAFADNWSFRKC